MELKNSNLTITEDMNNVFSLIEQGKNLFITGKAGTGKTTLLKLISDEYKNTSAVVAPTGVAAINAGGVTIHSLFTLPVGVYQPNDKFPYRLPNSKRAVLQSIDILIIDEISMVRCDTMDAIDKRLRVTRKSNLPFGGVQIIMFGDMMQLPPVVTNDEGDVLANYYDNFYFFNANVFKTTSFEVVELSEIFRQRDEDFISLLNDVRNGIINDSSKIHISNMLNRKSSDNSIHLCALKNVAEMYNMNKLGEPTHIINAKITGDFNPKNASCDLVLKLRKDARVMITKNDTEFGNYYNGTLGFVKEITKDFIQVLTDDGKLVHIIPEMIKSYKYDVKMDVDEVGNMITKIDKQETGTCTQFPLTLAYAITIHKSQGLTFDHVTLHIREIFQSGQLYTALSRCRKMENVSIDTNITNDMLMKNDTIENFLYVVRKNNNMFGTKQEKTLNNKKNKNNIPGIIIF